MQPKLSGSALGAGLGYLSGIQALIPVGAIAGWQLAAFFGEKELDGEKIAYGNPGDNGSLPNYKRALPNSIRWTKASTVKKDSKQIKNIFYENRFSDIY